MRIAVGGIIQESNTFTPGLMDLAGFRENYLLLGDDVFQMRGVHEVGGMLAVLEDGGHEIVPLLATHAIAGTRVTAETQQWFREELIRRIEAGRPDGVVIALMGAMASETDDDCDGTFLTDIREIIGPDRPLIASLDMHADVTDRMVRAADALIGYKTCPHVDIFETGQRAARLLLRTLNKEVRPRTALARRPMVPPPQTHYTTGGGPMDPVLERCRRLEEGGQVLDLSVFPPQPWLDVPDLGFKVVAVADGDMDTAHQAAEQVAETAWRERRRFFDFELLPPKRAIERALQAPDGPVALMDCCDNPGGGSPGDSVSLLRALVEQRLTQPAYVTVRDASAVAHCIEAGVGRDVTLQVGHTLTPELGSPIEIRGRVRRISDGVVTYHGNLVYGGSGGRDRRGPQPLARTVLGRTVLLQADNVSLVLIEQRGQHFDPELYRMMGLPPERARIIAVKSSSPYGYLSVTPEIHYVDGSGYTPPDLARLPFHRVTRPLLPLDSI
ncbi:MAG: M81 family metallopeptidase [bacterium]